jgi:hypothetical protein
MAPCCSSCITKKSGCRMPAVAVAQNLLLKKLGLAQGSQVEATEFERYLNLFKDGLSEA